MSLRFTEWRLSLLTSLGLGAALGCGGATEDPFGEGAPGGTSGAAQGSQSGSVSGGANTYAGTGGRTGAGGSAPTAGRGNVPIAGKGGSPGVSGAGGAALGGRTGGGGAAGAAQGGALAVECKNPRPYPGTSASSAASEGAALVAPVDPRFTGFFQCDGGWLHRSGKTTCPSSLPRDLKVTPPDGVSGCTSDADCTERPHGYCAAVGQVGTPFCNYGCTKDSECDAGSICLCGDPVGRCTAASCEVDADCESGVCAGTPADFGCGVDYAFACTLPEDECASSADCGDGRQCTVRSEGRRCEPRPICGRPFLVEGQARTATPRLEDDGWSVPMTPEQRALDASLRAKLARHYTEIGLMEHASVAAFARFILELLAFAAPADLVRDAERALKDEIVHAELCFGLASAYAGNAVSPGALPMNGALDARTRFEIVKTAILEACIGETVAAVEARLACDAARDPEVRSVLGRIAEDEARHAELGWRFVHWVFRSADPELASALGRTLRELVTEESVRPTEHGGRESVDERLTDHGYVSLATRARAHELAFSELILPWTNALLARALAA